MLKAKAILESTKEVNYKSVHQDNLDKRYLIDNEENTKMVDIKYIIFINDSLISKHIIST